MKSPDEALDDLKKHVAEVVRQFVGGAEITSEAVGNAQRYLGEAETVAEQLAEKLQQLETAVDRSRGVLDAYAGGLLTEDHQPAEAA